MFAINRKQTAFDFFAFVFSVIDLSCLLCGIILCGPLRSVALLFPLYKICEKDDTLVQNIQCLTRSSSRRRAIYLVLISIIVLAFFDYDVHFDNTQKGYSFQHAIHHLIHHYGMSNHKIGLVLLSIHAKIRRSNSHCSFYCRLLAFFGAFVYNCIKYFDKFDQLMSLLCVASFGLGIAFDTLGRFGSYHLSFGQYILFNIIGVVIHLYQNDFSHPLTVGSFVAIVILIIAMNSLTEAKISYNSMYRDQHLLYDVRPWKVDTESLLHNIKYALTSGITKVMQHSDSRKIFYFLCLNLSFTIVEMLYGFWTNSLGLISDGFHMLFDCTALILGLYASLISKKKSNKTFTYGYGRAEILAGYVNGLFLVIVGVYVFIEAINRLFDPPDIQSDKLLVVSILGLFVNLIGLFAFGHHHHVGSCDHHACEKSFDDNVESYNLSKPKEHCLQFNQNISIKSPCSTRQDHSLYSKDEHSAHSGHSAQFGNDHSAHSGHSIHCGHDHSAHSGHDHSAHSGHDHSVHCGHDHSVHCGHDHSVNFCHSSHSGHDHSLQHSGHNNANMRGVFLHILADTLGSVGVIISSFLIKQFNWNISDPLCSLFIAILILLSVIPMLKEQIENICLRIPESKEKQFFQCLQKIRKIDGVLDCKNISLWNLSSNKFIGSISILKQKDFDENQLNNILKEMKDCKFYVQFEKGEYKNEIY